jgi:ABC-type protease/lipase transport system fused ATPase/permease subunit
MFGDPVLFVMDEPNSNLDADGEVALDRAIRASMKRGAAVVVVAHRPSALQAMDGLLVLTNGTMAAIGTRDEIMRKVMAPQQSGQPNPNMAQQRPQAQAITASPLSYQIAPPNKRN